MDTDGKGGREYLNESAGETIIRTPRMKKNLFSAKENLKYTENNCMMIKKEKECFGRHNMLSTK